MEEKRNPREKKKFFMPKRMDGKIVTEDGQRQRIIS